MSDLRLAEIERESPLAARLAELASLAVRIDAGLLRRLRRAFLPEADPGVESDLWFSAMVASRSATGFQLAPDLLPTLRERLAREEGRPPVREVRAVLAEAHAGMSAAIRLEEEVNGAAVELGAAGRPAIEVALRPALRALTQGGEEAARTARWAVHAVPRLHSLVLETAAARALLLAASLHLRSRPRRLRAASESASALDELAWALPSLASAERERVGVELVPGGLQFCAPEEASAAIEVPAGTSRIVELEWAGVTETHRRLSEAEAGALVALEGEPEEVLITTLAGDQYRLSAAWLESEGDAPGKSRPPVVAPPERLLEACVRIVPLGSEEPICVAFAVSGHLLLAPRARVGSLRFLRIHGRADHVEVLPWGPGEGGEEHGDELVRLRWVAALPFPLGPDVLELGVWKDEVAIEWWGDMAEQGAIAGFEDGRARWFRAVVEPRGESWSAVRGVVWNPPSLAPGALTAAFVGAPFVVGERLAGAVLDIAPAPDGQPYAIVELATASYLQSVLLRAAASEVRESPTESSRAESGRAVAALTIYLSGAKEELELREELRTALERAGHRVVQAEREPGGSAEEKVVRLLEGADLLVAVPWHDSRAVEHEYERARELAVPRLVFLPRRELVLPREIERAGEQLERFRARLERQEKVQYFARREELAALVLTALEGWQSSRRSAGDDDEDVTEAADSGRWELSVLQIRSSHDSSLIFESDRLEPARLGTPAGAVEKASELIESARFGLAAPVVAELFDLLLPDEVRAVWERSGALHLHLDASAIQFPWEILHDPSGTREPAALRGGVTRWYERAQTASEFVMPEWGAPQALVIGASTADAVIQEAQKIGGMLEAAGCRVTTVVDQPPERVLSALKEGPFEIVHVAARGLWETGSSGRFLGVSMGGGQILGASDLAEIIPQPRLLFLNASELAAWGGAVDVGAERMGLDNIAISLLRRGAGAVIGPASPVGETEALRFAETFYRAVAAGATVAHGVLRARRALYVSLAERADWAAYHCYAPLDLTLFNRGPEAR